MNNKLRDEGKCKDLNKTYTMQNNATVRSDAGEPAKTKVTKTNNKVKPTNGSNESDRGDAAANKKKQDQTKNPAICTTAKVKESLIKRADVNSNILNLNLCNTDNNISYEAKYNKIMTSINKIIQENIDLINTKTSGDSKNENGTQGSKVTGECYIDRKEPSKIKQPDKISQRKEFAKNDDKALVNFSKKMTNTKASNCTPLDVAKTVNDINNKSLVIKIPKHIGGSKLQEKPKVSNEMNKKNPESTPPRLNSLQQKNSNPTTEMHGVNMQTRDILTNKKSYWAAKIQTVSKNINQKTKNDSKTEIEKDDCYMKKLAKHKVKHMKRKQKRVKSPLKSSGTKLLLPMVVDEHTKLYYEAWVNNTVTISSQEQQSLDDTILQRLPSSPVSIQDMTPEDYTDKRFTGTIKVNYKKNIQ